MNGRALIRNCTVALAALFAAELEAAAQPVRVVREGPDRVVLRVETPAPALDPSASQHGRMSATLSGSARFSEAGLPRIPYVRALVGVPEGSRPVLRVRAPGARRISDASLEVESASYFGFARDEREAAGSESPLPRGRWPKASAEIASTGWMRDLQVAEVRFYPVRSAGRDGGVLHEPWIEAELVFVPDTASGATRRAGRGASEAYREVQRRAIVNWEQVEPTLEDSLRVSGSIAAAESAGSAAPEALLSGTAPLKLTVTSDGLYRVSPADLTAAGVNPATVDPRDFRLENRGAPVAVEVLGESDGVFDPADRLVFFGRALAGPYTRANVYWLHFDGSGARAALRDGTYGAPAPTPASFATTVHAELNLIYTQNVPAAAIDRWWWTLQTAGDPSTGSVNYTVAAPSVDPAPHTIAVRVNLQGRSLSGLNPDHHTRILLNNTLIADATWDGQVPFTHSVNVASSLLLSGSNTVRIQMVGDTGASVDQVYVNWFEIDYNRTYAPVSNALVADGEGAGEHRFVFTGFATSDILVFDATDANAPVRIGVPAGQITGAGPFDVGFQDSLASDRIYAAATIAGLKAPAAIVQDVPSNLLASSNGADWIAVAPPEFVAALQPLAAQRAAEGLRTAVVTTDDVYDEFNFGIFSPLAIKSFLAHAYANWTAPAPEYVLFAGDAHVDYLDDLGSGVKQFVPTVLVAVPGFGETPSDNELVTVAGSDVFPEIYSGRLPVRSAADLAVIVDKILAYETAPPVAALNARALFVADNDDVAFEAILDSFATLIPATTAADKIYLSQVGTAAAARAGIRAGFDDGSLTATYLGHGSMTQWASECIWGSPANSCGANDPNALMSSDRTSFVIALNCINGYFVDLTQAGAGHVNFSLAEAMVRQADRAAIAMFAPAALGTIADYSSIGDWIFRAIYLDREPRIGRSAIDAVVAAVTQPFSPADIGNLRELHLFGDPATSLALDSDGDAILDRDEEAAGLDPLDADSDDDGLVDGLEPSYAADADGDGLANGLDPDGDDDGLFDGTESGITVAPAGTDTARGFFVPDADPLTMTDALDPDSDGGGVADGAEDRDFDGQLDPGETDPTAGHAADDPVCASPLPEIQNLTVSPTGADLTLSWNSILATHPCALYRIYASDNPPYPKSSFAPFRSLALTSAPVYTHAGAMTDGKAHDWLVTAFDPVSGEGPLGHYGR